MGLEATTLAYIGMALSAAGAGAQAHTARSAAKEQDQAAARGIRNQQMKQREIDERVSQGIGDLEGSTPEEETAQSLEQFMQQLRGANTTGSDIPVTGGRYGEDTAASKAAIGNYGEKVAQILSRIRGASEQRVGEGYAVGRMGSDVAGQQREASGQAFLDQLRLNGIRPNDWTNAAGSVAQGVGGAMVSRAGTTDPTARHGSESLAAPAKPGTLAYSMRNPWAAGLEPR
jgi:hypothetical protein